MNKTEYKVYIDESGDTEIDRGTNWFILTAVIVKKSNLASIQSSIKLIKKEGFFSHGITPLM